MICGLQKMTLLDFPGKIACTVFLGGCNFRCPFCHNSELFMGKPEKLMEDEEFFQFLSKRKGLLDGVCVSGGEPTLYKDLPDFLGKIKEMGFLVKLDTNGYRPEVLKTLVERKLVDYVAMDVKNSPTRYADTVGLARIDLSAVEESLRFLLSGNVEDELRTTVAQQLHDSDSIDEMGRWVATLGKPGKWFLQAFTDRDTVAFSGLSAPADAELSAWRELLSAHAEQAAIRGE